MGWRPLDEMPFCKVGGGAMQQKTLGTNMAIKARRKSMRAAVAHSGKNVK